MTILQIFAAQQRFWNEVNKGLKLPQTCDHPRERDYILSLCESTRKESVA